jgi:hypothetical protein
MIVGGKGDVGGLAVVQGVVDQIGNDAAKGEPIDDFLAEEAGTS